MIKVLYEDNHFLIVDKPSNLPTQVSQEHTDALETRAKAYVKHSSNKTGAVFLHAVHRLDKEVSGIVVFAKTSKALERFNELLRERKVKKLYHARVEGRLKEPSKVLSGFIFKADHKAIMSAHPKEGFKSCLLSYKLIEQQDKEAFIEIDLDTGRYHQIRAQLSFLGHPVIGDQKYGSSLFIGKGVIALKQTFLEFVHPVKNTLISLKSPF